MIAIRLLLLWGLAIMAVAGRAEAQAEDALGVRAAEALNLLERAFFDQAIDSLRSVAADADRSGRARLSAQLHAELALAFWALRSQDSIEHHLREALRRSLFIEMPETRFHPRVLTILQQLKRSTIVVELLHPNDTIVHPDSQSFPLRVAVGRPARVDIFVSRADSAPDRRPAETADVDSIAAFAIGFDPGLPDGPQTWTVRVTAVAGILGVGADTAVSWLEVTRLGADTLVHADPLDSAAFLPVTRKGSPPLSSLLKGVAFGTAAALIPLAATPSGLPSGGGMPAAAVGASMALGGLLGMAVGRPDVPIEENIAHNNGLVDDWNRQRDATIAENSRRRIWVPLRIRRRDVP